MLKRIVIKMIKFYKKYISQYLSTVHNIHCKYEPTCSEYTIQAIEKYGVIRGIGKGFLRILKCNPFSKGGYDPLK